MSKPRIRGNGRGSVYKRGRTWTAQTTKYVQTVHEDGERETKRVVERRGGFGTKREAMECLENVLLQDRQEVQHRTISEYWADFLEGEWQDLSDSQHSKYKSAYRRLEPLHDQPLALLNIGDLQRVVNEQAKTYYTSRDMRDLLSKFYQAAIANQDATTNLASFIRLPQLDEEPPDPFTKEEIAKLWDKLEERPTIGRILLMIYSGMMPGELLKCTVSMVDLEACMIVGSGLKTKTRKAAPIVFPQLLTPIVQSMIESAGPDGQLINRAKWGFYNDYKEDLAACGIRYHKPYACRHTTATALALGNEVAPSVIQRIMRHANFSTTERYIHPDNSDAQRGVNTLLKSNADA